MKARRARLLRTERFQSRHRDVSQRQIAESLIDTKTGCRHTTAKPSITPPTLVHRTSTKTPSPFARRRIQAGFSAGMCRLGRSLIVLG